MMTARIAGGAPLQFYGEPLHFVSSAIDPALFVALDKGGVYTPFSREAVQRFLDDAEAQRAVGVFGACIYIGRTETAPVWLIVVPRRDRGEGVKPLIANDSRRFWAWRFNLMVGPFTTREEALRMWIDAYAYPLLQHRPLNAKGAEARLHVVTGYGAHGPWFDLRSHDIRSELEK